MVSQTSSVLTLLPLILSLSFVYNYWGYTFSSIVTSPKILASYTENCNNNHVEYEYLPCSWLICVFCY